MSASPALRLYLASSLGLSVLKTELRITIRRVNGGNPAQDEGVRQCNDDTRRVRPALERDCLTFPAVLIQNVRRPACLLFASEEVRATMGLGTPIIALGHQCG